MRSFKDILKLTEEVDFDDEDYVERMQDVMNSFVESMSTLSGKFADAFADANPK